MNSIDNMLRRARTTTENIQAIYDDETRKLTSAYKHEFVATFIKPYSSYKSRLHAARRECQPKQAKTADEIVLSDTDKLTSDGEQFLLFDEYYQENNESRKESSHLHLGEASSHFGARQFESSHSK
jgi:hypothetical protein